jgi:hypothetical protein
MVSALHCFPANHHLETGSQTYKSGNGCGGENRVNILKKVKAGKNWNLYSAVVEPNGKFHDKVRVRGKIRSSSRRIILH